MTCETPAYSVFKGKEVPGRWCVVCNKGPLASDLAVRGGGCGSSWRCISCIAKRQVWRDENRVARIAHMVDVFERWHERDEWVAQNLAHVRRKKREMGKGRL